MSYVDGGGRGAPVAEDVVSEDQQERQGKERNAHGVCRQSHARHGQSPLRPAPGRPIHQSISGVQRHPRPPATQNVSQKSLGDKNTELKGDKIYPFRFKGK